MSLHQSLKAIAELSDDEVWALSVPRPGHPEQRGFLFPGKDIDNVDELATLPTVLVKRLAKIQNGAKVYNSDMKPINFGKTDEGEDVCVDLEQAGIHFVLLAGMTGSGKSVFATHLYRELMDAYTLAELGFVVLDMTQVSFSDWDPAYLARPVITDPDEALAVFETLQDDKRMIFVHIEECDMVYRDRTRFEKAIERILHENKNITIVYSTSRIDPDYLADWLEQYIDMKVVFRVANPVDSQFLLGSDATFLFREPGERIIAYGDKLIPCRPFSEA